MEKCLIVAVADNYAIGRRNQLLWNLPEDMKYFREQTTGHPVIMGWMTYHSVGRPLPRRTNIVISIFPWPEAPEKVVVVDSLEAAFAAAEKACEGQEDAVRAQHLAKFALSDLAGADVRVIRYRAQARTRKAYFRFGVFTLQPIGVKCRGECILAEVGKTEQCGEGDAAHSSHEGAFLRVEAVGPHALVTEKVQFLVLLHIVGLLEHRHVVRTASAQIAVFVGVHGINLKPNEPEVLTSELACVADVLHAAHATALAREKEDFRGA